MKITPSSSLDHQNPGQSFRLASAIALGAAVASSICLVSYDQLLTAMSIGIPAGVGIGYLFLRLEA